MNRRSIRSHCLNAFEFADVIVIGKQDLVSPDHLQRVIGAVKALNPTADIVCTEHGRVPLAKVLGTGKFNLERASNMAGWARELAGLHTPETHTYGIDSFVLRMREPLHPKRFAAFLQQSFPGLLRAKGYVWLASRPEWAVAYARTGNIATIEPVGQWWAAAPRDRWPPAGTPERKGLDATWQEPYGDRINEVVFIGQAVERADVENAFRACRLTANEIRKGPRHWRNLPDPFPTWVREAVDADAATVA